jgi:hypothetical protein
VKEKERTDDVEFVDRQPSRPAQDQEHRDIEIQGRQNTHGSPEIKAAQTNGAAFFVLAE